MIDGFRIGRVVIEGFKGFTTRREIDLRDRHAFLLGSNGNGKSSIIEAIRWGLFGSTGRPNDIVANQGYSGGCRVEITLKREGKEWNLRRSLIRGVSGGSDAALLDGHGQEHSIREIMPLLDSVDAGEGTHIVFAPQSAPLRRQPEDLTAFERTVFNHLGLTHPRVLLSHLKDFLSDQESTEGDLDERLTVLRKRLDTQIAQLEHQRGRILGAPPWSDVQAPTVTDSEGKTKALIENITGQSPDPLLSGTSLGALIEYATDALQGKEHQDQGAQHAALEKVRDRLRRLQKICQTQERAGALQSTLDAAQDQLDTLLDGTSLDELRERAVTQRHATDTVTLKRQLAVSSIEVLHRDEGDPVLCPVCAREHRREDLESLLSGAAGAPANGDPADLRRLNERVQEAEAVILQLQALHDQIKELEVEVQSLIGADELTDFAEAVNDGQIAAVIDSLTEREASIAGEIADKGKWFEGMSAELSNLREEERYHHTQKNLHSLATIKTDLQRVERTYQEFVSFGQSVAEICDVVESRLTEQLEDKLPGVENELTRVFVALTRHPHYDRMVIDKGHLPHLKLQVASSHDSGLAHTTAVLNGQAQGAVELVPYFALSQASGAPTEVYLVLLDDPTRAFDGEHIKILIERLADLGRRVQVIVASQETDRFRQLLPRSFARSSYVVVEPKNWSYDDSPKLDAEYE